MKPLEYSLLLTAYSFLATALLAWVGLTTRRRFHLFVTAFAAVVLVASTATGYWIEPGRSYPELVFAALRRRDLSAALVVVWGFALAVGTVLPACLLARRRAAGDSLWLDATLFGGATALGVSFAVCQAFTWAATGHLQRDPPAYAIDPAFRVEKIAELDYAPIRIAAGGGRVFVCYDYFDEAGDLGGSVVELYPEQPRRKPRVVIDSPLLARCYGLAFHEGELYVSRAGFWGRADQGAVDYAGTGAVTRFSDLDGDGYFEFAHDVVSNLPGVRGPETMHQNNAICFGPDESLYVTCASSANRALDLHPWGGTVLRVSPDDERIEIFVQGLRNPFAITCTPDGQLFATDNDVDENPGDKILHLRAGAHYGHPYVLHHRNEKSSDDFAKPIAISDEEENYLGVVFAASPSLPASYRGGLFIAEFLQEHIIYVGLDRVDETFRVSSKKQIARIPSPIDVALSDDGELYVISRNARRVYRIAPAGKNAERRRQD